jgi:putative transcriptional regulator
MSEYKKELELNVELEELEKAVVENLMKNGFTVFMVSDSTACFTIYARHPGSTLLIKVIYMLRGITEEQLYELKRIAIFMGGAPIIISKYLNKNQEMEDELVYLKFGLPVVTITTFLSYLNRITAPLVIHHRGSYYVQLDGKMIRDIRKEKKLSMGHLASLIGVSRRSVYEYERETTSASIETAQELEKHLQAALIKPLPLFSWEFEFEKNEQFENVDLKGINEEIFDLLSKIGISDQFWPSKSPMDALTDNQPKKDKPQIDQTMLLYVTEKKTSKTLNEAKKIGNLGRAVLKKTMIITGFEPEKACIEGVPAFTISELLGLKSPEEIFRAWIKRRQEGIKGSDFRVEDE